MWLGNRVSGVRQDGFPVRAPDVFRNRSAIGVLAIAMLSLLGVGCGSGGDGSERAVEWGVDRPVGPNWVRLSAVIRACNLDPPLLEEPIIEYTGAIASRSNFAGLPKSWRRTRAAAFFSSWSPSKKSPLSDTWTNSSCSMRALTRLNSVGHDSGKGVNS